MSTKINEDNGVVFLHIGLPKTGTSTMQSTVFPNFAGIKYGGKNGGVSESQTLSLMPSYELFMSGQDCLSSLNKWVSKVLATGSKRILVSEQALMGWRSKGESTSRMWSVQETLSETKNRLGKHPNNQFFSIVRGSLPDNYALRAILVLRNQADFLPSLSAQTGNSDPKFVTSVLTRQDDSLDWYLTVQNLQDTLGVDNLLILFFEDGLLYNSQKIAEFTGADWSPPGVALPSLNARKKGGIWKTDPQLSKPLRQIVRTLNRTRFGGSILAKAAGNSVVAKILIKARRNRQSISLTEEQQLAIRAHFKESNQNLATLIGRDLGKLGY